MDAMDSENRDQSNQSNWMNGCLWLVLLAVTTLVYREIHLRVSSAASSNGPPVFQTQFNTATSKELQLLPKVGKSLAETMIQFREQHGPIRSHDELRKIRGIGKEMSALLAPFLQYNEIASSEPLASPATRK
jgi:competence ComEA-like helix-hairpin-helix protein